MLCRLGLEVNHECDFDTSRRVKQGGVQWLELVRNQRKRPSESLRHGAHWGGQGARRGARRQRC